MAITKKEKEVTAVVEDVEMKSPAPVDEATKKAERENLVFEELKEHAKQIDKSINAKEPRYILRILRSLSATRKNINATVLRRVVNVFYSNAPAQKEILLAYIEEPMDIGADGVKAPTTKSVKFSVNTLPEHDVYFHLLVILYLLDLKKYKEVRFFCLFIITNIHFLNFRPLNALML